MPKQKRFKTNYPGVFYILGTRAGAKKPERIYYISFYKDRRKIEEKAGRQFKDAMTAALASRVRSQKIDGALPTNKERREAKVVEKNAKADKWTIDRLWETYKKGRKQNKALSTDASRYIKYLKPAFGNQEPNEILSLDVERLKRSLLKTKNIKKGKSAQTVAHILGLLNWIINYGVNNGLCPGLSFKIKMPEVHNEKTEDLTPIQLENLLKAIEQDTHPHAGTMMKLALYSGLRKGEMFKLCWEDVDFERGFITLRDPKGGPNQKIPLNDLARELLENHPRIDDSPFVFPGRNGKRRRNIYEPVNKIKKKAGIPKEFRPFHGLRHVYASGLASSGKVDMYQLQRLLTHKSPLMTQRYAHLRDDALKAASNVVSEIFNPAVK